MAKCHFDPNTQTFPVGCITDLTGEILINNFPADTPWVLNGCKVMVTRLFTASTAYVVLTADAADTKGSIPKPPDITRLEKEFCIWLGYINKPRLITPQDLAEGWLLRVFVGSVDTYSAIATERGGYTFSFQARDRTKYLMDSNLTYNFTPDTVNEAELYRSDVILKAAQKGIGMTDRLPDIDPTKLSGDRLDEYTRLKDAVDAKQAELDRYGRGVRLQEELSRRKAALEAFTKRNADAVIGGCGCGKVINESEEWTYDIVKALKTTNPQRRLPNEWYEQAGLKGSAAATPLTVNSNPEFRIYTGKGPITFNNEVTPQFLLLQTTPIDAIKALAMMEVYLTEVFQDHRDGNLYYVPRVNDPSGLDDSERFHRTYFFRNTPAQYGDKQVISPPNINQMMLSFKEERSSINLKTNFLLTTEVDQDGQVANDYALHLKTQPFELRGTNYACKFARIQDPTALSREEQLITALTYARYFAKGTRVGLCTLMGDPSFAPGELIQTFGSGLRGPEDYTKAIEGRKAVIEYETKTNEDIYELAELAAKVHTGDNAANDVSVTAVNQAVDGQRIRIDPAANTGGKLSQEDLLCKLASKVYAEDGSNELGYAEDPDTIYRVEGVVHKFNISVKGYVTELLLQNPL